MPLQSGDKLGPYEILARVGAGGMGEVYKARDTRLERIVAIKQCKGIHRVRFEQEARVIAALNHPHICQVFDVGADYLVMEYIEGGMASGPLLSRTTAVIDGFVRIRRCVPLGRRRETRGRGGHRPFSSAR